MENTIHELKEWAYDPNSFEPMQDYDLILVSLDLNDLIFQFASDNKCPKKLYFLACLYLIVGDAVRTEWKEYSAEEVAELLNLGRGSSDKNIQDWVTYSDDLIAKPSLFDYNLWCGGGYAKRES